MYRLMEKGFHGGRMRYTCIKESEDIKVIADTLKSVVTDGIQLRDLIVVKDMDFEFKCAIQWKSEETTNAN